MLGAIVGDIVGSPYEFDDSKSVHTAVISLEKILAASVQIL